MSKTALITGASSGIGWEIALKMGEQGYNLILVARNETKLNELKSKLKTATNTIDVIPMDLSDANAAKKLYARTTEFGRAVDILVNNAGFGEAGAFADITLERQEEMINLNVTALMALSHLYLPTMKKNKSGTIVNIASTAAFQPGPYMAVYFATKAFVLSFSEALAEELIGTGVSVTAICPGPTHSGFQAAAHMEETKLFKSKAIPSSQDVAAFTMEAIKNKQVVAIHGLVNNSLIFAGRFAPRMLARKIAKSLVKGRSQPTT
ncbi:MAG: SDR family oxidoreductase [Bdellovibrionaceae bacterium]|nr:SDR family oxidoreductase [Pseudobdellovibrionaceae bacterium]